MPVPHQIYTPHIDHGLRLFDPDPELFSTEPDEYDLTPYERDRQTVDGEDDPRQ